MNNIKILIVEDEKDIRELIKLQLELQNYTVEEAKNVNEALIKVDQNQYQLLLIDRMLPDMSGLSLCQKLRNLPNYQKTPIIMVTALSDPQNIIEGLDAGADDYITKPFEMNVLHARVRAQLRRHNNQHEPDNDIIKIDNLTIDKKKYQATISQEEINLTNIEFQILFYLVKEAGVVLTRERLLKLVMGPDTHVTTRTIDTHIVSLRKKLKSDLNLIETIRGVGYRFKNND